MIHGAPITVQDTSPTSLLFSVIVSVELIVPLMSIAWAIPAARKTAVISNANDLSVWDRVMGSYLFSEIFTVGH
jgi:hypothetical protein